MKILNFGSLNIDYVYAVDHICKPGETESADGLSVFPGGKGLNQSVALARAGADHYFAGCIGEDGAFLKELLEKNNIDTAYLKTVDGKNGHAIIEVSSGGENNIILFHGSNYAIDCSFVDKVIENFDSGDMIILQNEISKIEYIIEKAYEKGIKIVFNPSPFDEIALGIDFGKIEYLFINEVEGNAIMHFEKPEIFADEMLKKYPNIKVILTLGADGCYYFDKDNRIRQKAFDVIPVDTTAAGDTFTGFFIAETVRNGNIAHALKVASCASAIGITRNGATPSIPTIKEVEEKLSVLREK